ncbi:MAG: DUF4193 family protein [Acidimicrobiia bacterium]
MALDRRGRGLAQYPLRLLYADRLDPPLRRCAGFAAAVGAGGPGDQVENAGITRRLRRPGQTVAPTVSWTPHVTRGAGNTHYRVRVSPKSQTPGAIVRAPPPREAPEPRKTVMADDDDFDDDEPDLVDEADLEDDDLDLEVDVVAEVEVDVDDVLLVEEDPLEVVAVPVAGTVAPVEETTEEEDDDVVDLEEELHPDDVEEPLDVLLHERTTSDRLDEDATDLEDEDLEPDEKGDVSARVIPRRDDEFLCRSCFLVKPLSQLARGEKDLCRDCE